MKNVFLALYQGFIDFIEAQPPQKIIDNTSWSTCAVGEYYKEVLGVEIADNIQYLHWLRETDEDLLLHLNNNFFATYGDLQSYLLIHKGNLYFK